MGYGMKYKKGKGFPFKTDLPDLSGKTDKELGFKKLDLTKEPTGFEAEVKTEDRPEPIYEGTDDFGGVSDKKDQFVSELITEGSAESQNLRRKENEKKIN